MKVLRENSKTISFLLPVQRELQSFLLASLLETTLLSDDTATESGILIS